MTATTATRSRFVAWLRRVTDLTGCIATAESADTFDAEFDKVAADLADLRAQWASERSA